MKTWKYPSLTYWATRSLAVVVVLAGLGIAQPALAAYSAKITVYAPGAPAAAWFAVQHQETSSAVWQIVEGWEGPIAYTRGGVPYQQWSVDVEDYGKGSYRWVVYVEQGGAVWAVSDAFNLPTTNGVNQRVTVTGKTAIYNRAPTRVVTPPTLQSWSENVSFDTKGNAIARISIEVAGVSPTTYAVVQYQDTAGAWQNVAGWQSVVIVNAKGLATAQWGLDRASFGNGPLRWALYSEKGGTIIGYSPTFNLPTDVGIDLVMHLTL